jgi:hypothetical protein
MKTKVDLPTSTIATFLAIILLLQPFAWAGERPKPDSAQQVVEQSETTPGAPASQNPSSGNVLGKPAQPASVPLPDSPGALWSQNEADMPTQSDEPPAVQPLQQSPPHEPVGTAAAEWQPLTGVAASRPAGAALAPAKQRRVRSIVIKVGALLGAGVALGTVAALSAGSPSRPPGAR